MAGTHPPLLDWQGDCPLSLRFRDRYFAGDGLAESRHVFLAGNDLPARFRLGFHIGELGFGTGLNMLATLHAWRASAIPGELHYTAFEAFPMTAPDMARALRPWPELGSLAAPFLEAWATGARRIKLPSLLLEVIEGDARTSLPFTVMKADAWFLDGFAPSRNPELWEPTLLTAVHRRTVSGGTCATYSAAGRVRRALAEAGFFVERVSGFGAKRHMTRGHRRN